MSHVSTRSPPFVAMGTVVAQPGEPGGVLEDLESALRSDVRLSEVRPGL